MIAFDEGRASRFHRAEPTRWATVEDVPPDDREPHTQLSRRIARHAEAQDACLTPEERDRLWPNYGVPHVGYPHCAGCGATTGNSLPGYGRGWRSPAGFCARCYEREGAA